MRGFIYILINPSLEGLVKIGMTTRSTEERCAELSTSSGVPTPFLVVYEEEVNNVAEVEKRIHLYLEALGHRINNKREFFSIPVKVAVKAVNEVITSDPAFLDMDNPDSSEAHPSETEVSDNEIGDDIFSEAMNYLHGANGKLCNNQKCMELTLKAVKLGNKKAKKQLANLYDGKAFQCERNGDDNGYDRYTEKATLILQDLVEEDYQPAYSSLLYRYIDGRQYQNIPTFFKIAENSSCASNISCANNILGDLISQVLRSPDSGSFGIDIDGLVEKNYLPTTLWLLSNFLTLANSILSEIDLIFEKVEQLLNLPEDCEWPLFNDIQVFMSDKKYDVMDVLETKEILEGLLEKYSFNITGDVEGLKETIEMYELCIAEFKELKDAVELLDFITIISDAFDAYIADLDWQKFQDIVSAVHKIIQRLKS